MILPQNCTSKSFIPDTWEEAPALSSTWVETSIFHQDSRQTWPSFRWGHMPKCSNPQAQGLLPSLVNQCGSMIFSTGTIYLMASKMNKNKFECGQTDVFTVECVDLGDLKKIKIGHDNKGRSA